MKPTNDAIRRELGFGLIDAERNRVDRGWPPSIPTLIDQRKVLDEQCNGVSGAVHVTGTCFAYRVDPPLLGSPSILGNVRYFSSFADFELWDIDAKLAESSKSVHPEEKPIDLMAVTRQMCK